MYVVPTVHPAFALRDNYPYLAVIEGDLRRAVQIMKDGWKYNPKVVTVVPDGPDWDPERAFNTVQEFFDSFSLKESAPPISVDTETTGVDQYKCGLRAISFSQVHSERGLAIPYVDSVWLHVFPRVKQLIARVLGASVAKCFHNAIFDTVVLLRHDFSFSGKILDTLVAHHLLESELKHDLGFVAQRWLSVDPWKPAFHDKQTKANRKFSNADWKDLLFYAARDALEAARLWPVLVEELQKKYDNALQLLELDHWQLSLAVKMALKGLPIDESRRVVLDKQLTERVQKATALIQSNMQWPDFDPNKPAHRIELLYKRLELPVRKYTEKRKDPSTSYHAIVEHAGIPAVRALIEHDEAASLLSNVVGKYKNLSDGRLHVQWNVSGTDGSRWSSQPNLQNWSVFPINVRQIVEAPPGRVFVCADFDQLEARILAVFAGAKKLLGIFARKEDPHGFMAEAVFGDKFKAAEPKLRKALRDLTKRVVYGCNYGAGPSKVYMVLMEDKRLDVAIRSLLTKKSVAKILHTFFEVNPEILTWREAILEQANTLGRLEVPPFNRVKKFLVLPVEGPKAWNWPIQVCGHDHLILAMWRIDSNLRQDETILLNGHDAVIVECDESEADRVKNLVERAMYAELSGPAGNVALTATAKVVKNWGDA